MDKLLVDEREAVASLGIGSTMFRALVADGAIPCVRLGRRKLYAVAALEAFTRQLQGQSGSGPDQS